MKKSTITLTGVLQKCNVINNGRIYPKEMYDNYIREYIIKQKKMDRQKKIKMLNDRNFNKN